MCVKFHCPASALTFCCKDGEGEIHSSSDIESQKTLANSDGTIIICYTLDAEVRCPEGSCYLSMSPEIQHLSKNKRNFHCLTTKAMFTLYRIGFCSVSKVVPVQCEQELMFCCGAEIVPKRSQREQKPYPLCNLQRSLLI